MKSPNALSRRGFLRSAACCAAGLGLQTGVLSNVAKACTPSGKHVVCIFFDGGYDWLDWVVPVGAASMTTLRPGLMAPSRQFHNLTGTWGLHRNLNNLKARYDAGEVALIPQTHYVNSTGSHAESREQYLRGVAARGGAMEMRGVWVRLSEANNFPSRRCVISVDGTDRIVEPASRALIGDDLSGFGFTGVAAGEAGFPAQTAIDTIALGAPQNGQQEDLVNAWQAIGADVKDVQSALTNRVRYGLNSGLAVNLEEAETVIRGFPQQSSLTFLSVGGNDTHNGQTGANASLTTQFDAAIGAFLNSTADIADNVLLLVMSEFGRTNEENGNGGTDHAEATCMMVIGRAANGGVFTSIPSDQVLTRAQNSLPMVHNHATIQREIYESYLGLPNVSQVFSGLNYSRLGVIRS